MIVPPFLSFGENLLFKDKFFDYVIAAHVLEHTPYLEKFLAELQRVVRGGYIEIPDAFMERINPGGFKSEVQHWPPEFDS